MELILVRHAQPSRSRESSAPADPGLTAAGQAQAQALAHWLSKDLDAPPDTIVASPMRRARETAAAISETCDTPITFDERLAEFDMGASTYVPMELAGGRARREVAAALETGRWGDHRFDPEQFRLRVQAAFEQIVTATDGHRVVVVCHGGVLNSYLSTVLGRAHGMFFRPRYTSVSRLTTSRAGDVALHSLNEMPHAHYLIGDPAVELLK